ncbi:MAG: FHA domain-containing CAMK family serine/threonine-protein kinase [archaeon]|nr:FHA domain-containing CAMK family serine/threonine-protein kinase [archaeon]
MEPEVDSSLAGGSGGCRGRGWREGMPWGFLRFRSKSTQLPDMDIELSAPRVSLGRTAGQNDIVIRDPRISKTHCVFTHRTETYPAAFMQFAPQQQSLGMRAAASSSSEGERSRESIGKEGMAARRGSGGSYPPVPDVLFLGEREKIEMVVVSVVEIEHLSLNGVFINAQPLVQGMMCPLVTGDLITVLSDKNNHDDIISYTFENTTGLETLNPTHYLTNGQYFQFSFLGSGSFANIYRARASAAPDRVVAIKVIDKKTYIGYGTDLSVITREAQVMQSLDHVNIVRTFETFDSPRSFAIVMEYLPGGDLFDLIWSKGKLPEFTARAIFLQILEGLRYLHSVSVVHRDIKPENILLAEPEGSRPPLVKIADFGLAKNTFGTKALRTVCGTEHYMSPESLQNILSLQSTKVPLGYGKPVDLWSAGVVLYFMIKGELPFVDEPHSSALQKIQNAEYSFAAPIWQLTSLNCRHLISCLLNPNPEARFTAERSLKHPWFSEALPTTPPTPVVKLASGKVIMNNTKRQVRSFASDTESDSQSKRQHL